MGGGTWLLRDRDVITAHPTCGRSQLRKPLTLRPLSVLTSTIVPPSPEPLMTGQPWLWGVVLITESSTLCEPVATLGHVVGLRKNGLEAGHVGGTLS